MKKIRFYIFCVRWLWRYRNWKETRQKYKKLAKDWRRYSGMKLPEYLRWWTDLIYWEE